MILADELSRSIANKARDSVVDEVFASVIVEQYESADELTDRGSAVLFPANVQPCG
jgi:hypothetical protein